jgi:hypothetical protein
MKMIHFLTGMAGSRMPERNSAAAIGYRAAPNSAASNNCVHYFSSKANSFVQDKYGVKTIFR